MRVQLACVSLTVSLFACQAGPEAEAEETSGSETETDTDTGTDGELMPKPIEGCECILDEDVSNPDLPPMSPTCGEPLCPLVSAVDNDDGFMLDDRAPLDCALTALRDRTPGLLQFSYSESFGQFVDTGYVLILADGRAVRRGWGQQDLSFEVDEAKLGELRPVAQFEGCLADPDSVAFGCLRQPLAGEDAICDEGWQFSEP
jgi:hypothetical protein